MIFQREVRDHILASLAEFLKNTPEPALRVGFLCFDDLVHII